MNTTVTLAWRNLWRHGRRTWLTVSAMVFSNVLLVFMITLQFGSYELMIANSLRAFSAHLQIAAEGFNDNPKMRTTVPQINALAQQLRSNYPQLSISPRAQTFVLAASEQRSFGLQVAGVDAQTEADISTIPGLVRAGNYLHQQGENEIVIGSVLARNLKVEVGDEITLLGSGYDGSFAATVMRLVGIFESGIADVDRSLSQIHLEDFNTIFSMGDRGHTIMINAPDIDDTALFQQQIGELLKEYQSAVMTDPGQLELLNWEQLNPGLRQAIQSDIASAWFMYAVLIVLVAFSVLNTQLMSVLERTREFGIMSAIGLRPARLGRLVLLETAVMASLGLLLGCLLGALVALYFRINGLSLPGMEEMAAQYNLPPEMYPTLKPLAILLGPAVVFTGCMLAAIYPSMKLRGLEPVAAMRAA